MRKSLYFLTLLIATIGAPIAHANTTYLQVNLSSDGWAWRPTLTPT